MSRKRTDEIAFGSDSFLDVVCNLVGILIVLIIVAGLRISRAPVPLDAAADRVETAEVEPVSPLPAVETAAPIPAAEPIAAQPIVLPPAQPPADLVTRADALRARLLALQSDVDSAQRQRDELEQRYQSAQARLALACRAAEAAADDAASVRDVLSEREASIAEQERLLAAARRELQHETAAEPETPILAHRVTPVGRQVEDQVEVHFRLAGGRVSVVPIDALAADLKARVERHSDMLFRVARYEGSIGPVEGYTMHYVIERQQPDALEELRNGPVVRIGLSYYEIEPKPDAPTESYDEAASPRSRFRSAIAQAGPNAVITFWVYPDSFELHRRLQELLHSSGYTVAARPLPEGVPIAGSPNGSKSVAQ